MSNKDVTQLRIVRTTGPKVWSCSPIFGRVIWPILSKVAFFSDSECLVCRQLVCLRFFVLGNDDLFFSICFDSFEISYVFGFEGIHLLTIVSVCVVQLSHHLAPTPGAPLKNGVLRMPSPTSLNLLPVVHTSPPNLVPPTIFLSFPSPSPPPTSSPSNYVPNFIVGENSGSEDLQFCTRNYGNFCLRLWCGTKKKEFGICQLRFLYLQTIRISSVST